jgi:hypothetical protein
MLIDTVHAEFIEVQPGGQPKSRLAAKWDDHCKFLNRAIWLPSDRNCYALKAWAAENFKAPMSEADKMYLSGFNTKVAFVNRCVINTGISSILYSILYSCFILFSILYTLIVYSITPLNNTL